MRISKVKSEKGKILIDIIEMPAHLDKSSIEWKIRLGDFLKLEDGTIFKVYGTSISKGMLVISAECSLHPNTDLFLLNRILGMNIKMINRNSDEYSKLKTFDDNSRRF